MRIRPLSYAVDDRLGKRRPIVDGVEDKVACPCLLRGAVDRREFEEGEQHPLNLSSPLAHPPAWPRLPK